MEEGADRSQEDKMAWDRAHRGPGSDGDSNRQALAEGQPLRLIY